MLVAVLSPRNGRPSRVLATAMPEHRHVTVLPRATHLSTPERRPQSGTESVRLQYSWRWYARSTTELLWEGELLAGLLRVALRSPRLSQCCCAHSNTHNALAPHACVFF